MKMLLRTNGKFLPKYLTAVICALALVIVLATVVMILTLGGDEEPSDNGGEGEGTVTSLSGTYSVSFGAASDADYTFDGDNYTASYIKDGIPTTEEGTYRIFSSGNEYYIAFTTSVTGEERTTEHSFYAGTYLGREFISINEQYYYKLQ